MFRRTARMSEQEWRLRIARQRAQIAVVAIPKTIDDDIDYIDKAFGFDTAVEHARAAIDAAHAEALAA